MDVLTTTEKEIHAIMKVISSPSPWLLSFRFEERQILWDNFCSISLLHDLPWTIVGDFNDVINGTEKLGGNPVSLQRITTYRNCMNFCNMIDLGFSGATYMWTKRRDVNVLI